MIPESSHPLVIRLTQAEALGSAQRERFVDDMCRHLRAHFGSELAGLDAPALRARISAALDDAAGFGLTSARDCCRYLNLAAAYGWDFSRAPGHAWMRHYLVDPAVSDPGERLALLVDECLRRRSVEESNRRLRQEFQPPASEAPEEEDEEYQDDEYDDGEKEDEEYEDDEEEHEWGGAAG